VTAKVCIIGAGASGIASAQVLAAHGIEFDCFEMGSDLGGNWRYQNDNGVSGGYESLHLNSSKRHTEFAAYPMPDHYPAYPSQEQVLAYFEDYVSHFGLREMITFNTEVISVVPTGQAEGRFEVTLRGRYSDVDEVRSYDHVLVCNGHHWAPRWPQPAFAGVETFTGEQMHAHQYRTPEVFIGKRVLVLGIGNSAADISVESSRMAAATFLAMRRGAHVMPKFVMGRPLDDLTKWPLNASPLGIQKIIARIMLRLNVGKPAHFGLPEPDHAPLEAHPTVSSELLSRLGHGDISVKPNVARFEGNNVHFVDGSSEQIDLVVYCTGYHISFPFLSDKVMPVTHNEVALYHRVVSPAHPSLYFIGLIQPIGSIVPLAEQQAWWVAEIITGKVDLPNAGEMRLEIQQYDQSLRSRYVKSGRHTIQVDGAAYKRELARERRKRLVKS
jgi:dimethylaniline monooxygenase (N-oxide forming)